MVTKLINIDDLHFENQLWKCETKFYKDELKIYQNRLEEVASKNTKVEISKQIEHFQNQFIIQKDQLNLLSHRLKADEEWIAKYMENHPGEVNQKSFPDHDLIREKMETFTKLYSEMKQEFNSFLSIWM